jgi:hypothetical protein
VLVACEFSGVVRDAFRARGHDAYSCDLLEGNSDYHYQEDVFHHLNTVDKYDLMIAHPPCTYLCNSGVRWLHTQEGRREKMIEAAKFFDKLLTWPGIDKIAVENPIMHKYAREIVGKKQDQVIQPWQFGHGETKATCLWLKNLPPLVPTDIVDGREARIHKLSPSKDRGMLRSITYKGIAEAMASQWG